MIGESHVGEGRNARGASGHCLCVSEVSEFCRMCISPERGDSGHVPGVGISTGLGSLSLSPSFCAPREGWLQGSSLELAHSGSKVILTL